MASLGEQGWRSGESTRLPPMLLGIDSRTRRNMWVEFVVDCLVCSERFFSGYSGFPLSSKTNMSKFPFDPDFSGRIATLWRCNWKFLLLLLFLQQFHWRCSQKVRLIFVWSDPTCHCRREIVRRCHLLFGVPQGSCLGPFFFPVYVSKSHLSYAHAYADDTQ